MVLRLVAALEVLLVHVAFQAHDAEWDFAHSILAHEADDAGSEIDEHTQAVVSQTSTPGPTAPLTGGLAQQQTWESNETTQDSLVAGMPSSLIGEEVAEGNGRTQHLDGHAGTVLNATQAGRGGGAGEGRGGGDVVFVLFCGVLAIMMLMVTDLLLFRERRGADGIRSAEDTGLSDERPPCASDRVDDFDDIIPERFGFGDVERFAEESEKVYPMSEAELDQILRGAGVDTSNWGFILTTLQGQISHGECWLTYDTSGHEDASSQPLKLVRRLRLIIVRICALFPTGLRVLKCIRSCDNGVSKAKNTHASKKAEMHTIVEDSIPDLIEGDLGLPHEWQQEHLRVVRRTINLIDSSTGERGGSFPGLYSQYWADEVWIRIADVNAKDIGGRLRLPNGEGEVEIVEPCKKRIRYWQWNECDEEGWPSCVYAPIGVAVASSSCTGIRPDASDGRSVH